MKPHTEQIVTVIARLLDLGSSSRYFLSSLRLVFPLIPSKLGHSFVDSFSPLQKKSNIIIK
jgi:hypothetical protein